MAIAVRLSPFVPKISRPTTRPTEFVALTPPPAGGIRHGRCTGNRMVDLILDARLKKVLIDYRLNGQGEKQKNPLHRSTPRRSVPDIRSYDFHLPRRQRKYDPTLMTTT